MLEGDRPTVTFAGDTGQRQPGRDAIQGVVHAGREGAETDVSGILPAPHGIQHVAGTVGQGQGRSARIAQEHQADAGPEQGGQHRVGQVFRHALHVGPGHAVRVEFCSLADHNPAQGLARGAEILLFQVPCNAQGAFLQTARRQADIDRKNRRASAPRRAAIPFRQQNQSCRRPGRGQDDKRACRHSGPEHAPTIRAEIGRAHV